MSLAALLLASWSGLAGAVDLGVQGSTWAISEPDIRLAVVSQLSEVDWEAKREKLREQAEDYTEDLAGWEVPTADETDTRQVDPSIVVEEDIEGMMRQPDGSYEYEVVVEAGTRHNPLKHNPPQTWLFFFDGTDPQQTALARKLVERHPLSVRPVMTNGDPGEAAEDWSEPVFRAQEWHFRRLNVERVPALAGVDPETPLRVTVTEFGPPWDVSIVEECLP
jgi:conjugal transfer pilus assembly protein TraW